LCVVPRPPVQNTLRNQKRKCDIIYRPEIDWNPLLSGNSVERYSCGFSRPSWRFITLWFLRWGIVSSYRHHQLLTNSSSNILSVKLKVKVTLEQATKAPRGSRCLAILYLQTRRFLMGVGDQHHAPAALPQGKVRYPLYRRLGGPQDILSVYVFIKKTVVRQNTFSCTKVISFGLYKGHCQT
jgi:hypothetical protein